MIGCLLLGPGHFVGMPGRPALEKRRQLARLLTPGRHVIIMEDEPQAHGETDADKFLRLVHAVDEVVVWLPKRGRLPTVFAELVAIRMAPSLHGLRVVVFHEHGVVDTHGGEFLSRVPSGQIAYLRDLRDVVDLRILAYTTEYELRHLLEQYGQGFLDAVNE